VETVRHFLARSDIRALVIAVGSVVFAYFAGFLIRVTAVALARKTVTDLDDRIVDALRRPIFLSLLFIGLRWAAEVLPFSPRLLAVTTSFLETAAVVIWMIAGFRIGDAVLASLSRRAGSTAIVQPRTLPVFEILIRIGVIGAAIYFTFVAWHVDLTAWLASAGIVGIAIGFAAKDTLANLFSGVFILADAPYKVGDWIVLDGGLRGKVMRIGVRSTRVLTTDDIEITVPNAVIGGSKIINEAGGPSTKQRLRIKVSCAYGSDVDVVRKVLESCAIGVEDVCREPKPQVAFRSFGDSGLDFELHVWLEDPGGRERLVDRLNTRVYKELGRAGIEIPYPKRDVYIKQLPGS
jgi:MscS family membrane protein